MKKITKLAAIAMMAIVGLGLCSMQGCEKKKRASNEIIGSWKCVGFGNTTTNNIKEIEPKDCEKCYTLTLNVDGTLTGHTSTNDVMGKFEADRSTKRIKFTQIGGTLINELFDGPKYVKAIHDVHSYNLTEQGDLQLIYNEENEYLLFKSIKK